MICALFLSLRVLQRLHAFELAQVVGHKRQPFTSGMGCNVQVGQIRQGLPDSLVLHAIAQGLAITKISSLS